MYMCMSNNVGRYFNDTRARGMRERETRAPRAHVLEIVGNVKIVGILSELNAQVNFILLLCLTI